ncbi:unnamed protein product [Calypogeia fissa]
MQQWRWGGKDPPGVYYDALSATVMEESAHLALCGAWRIGAAEGRESQQEEATLNNLSRKAAGGGSAGRGNKVMMFGCINARDAEVLMAGLWPKSPRSSVGISSWADSELVGSALYSLAGLDGIVVDHDH